MKIQIIVNDQTIDLDDNDTISALLDQLKRKKEGIALAVNQTIIPKIDWSNHILKQDDNVTIFQVIAGG